MCNDVRNKKDGWTDWVAFRPAPPGTLHFERADQDSKRIWADA